MAIPKIRAGNDFVYVWAIERNGVAVDLTAATKVRLSYGVGKPCNYYTEIPFEIIDGNKVRSSHNYENTGTYNLRLEFTMAGVDSTVDIDAFAIVPRSALASEATDFAVTSDMAIGFKGDPFTYDDFTPEQIAELQQPATDAIASIQEVELAVETAEAIRVQAEIDRQTNTATAITNANNAATNANTKAGLADTAANNANAKATLANDAAIIANEKAGLANTAAINADNARLAIQDDLALKANQADVTKLTVEMNTLTKPLDGSFTYKSELDIAFPSGNSGLYLIIGDVKEVDTLTITGGATTNGNFGVLLNGVIFYTAVLSGDTADTVASKIRANAGFQGWIVSGSGTTIIFTDSQSRAVVAPSINPTVTGVTGTFIRTTLGVAPDGKWYYWNGSAWVAGGEYMAILNTLENYKLETLKKTHTGAINELNDAKNKLDLKVEMLGEKEQPLYIEMGTFTVAADAPSTNANATITVTSQSSNVLTGNFSVWGSSKAIAGVVEFSDGTYDTGLIVSYNTNSATFSQPFAKTVVKAGCVHDAINGQHLSDLGYYAMAQHLFNYPKRTAYRQELVKGMNMQSHSRLSVIGNRIIFKNDLTNKTVLEIDAIGGYNPGFINITNSTLQYYKLTPKTLNLNNTFPAVVGGGYEIVHSADYTGYIELFLGTDLNLAGKVCEVRLIKDGATVYSQQFSGETKRIILNHDAGNYKIQIIAVEANANPYLSGIFFWKKREIVESIWSKDDRILFLTDSWGAFPEASDPLLKPKQFDGTPSSGMSYMPIKFKDYFIAMGGRASNIFLATRGGQTSEWAKYWLPYAIKETMPTKIVFHFGINDANSVDEYAGTIPSSYDFDPDIMFASKYSNAGGVFGSVSKQRYEDNINWIAEYCASKGVTPIFFMPPKVASLPQAQTLQGWSMDIYAEGLKKI